VFVGSARMFGLVALLVPSTACVRGLTQVAGTGALYYTRCSADMLLEGEVYRVPCTPEECATGFATGPVSHVVVALDPGRKVVGYAERVCIQDLARASGLFHPTLMSSEPLAAPTEAP
jgi:hypothetical protein